VVENPLFKVGESEQLSFFSQTAFSCSDNKEYFEIAMEKLMNGVDSPLLVPKTESKHKLSSTLGISIALCLAISDVVKQVANYSLQVRKIKHK